MSMERIDTIVIGGGQAGLTVGYHLQRLGVPFLILDASERVGDAWRSRWESLRLFTPARFSGLDGMPFPAADRHSFPTKDEMAEYLEAYASRFDLPVRTGMRVTRLSRSDGRFIVEVGARCFEADRVVVAMSDFQEPKVPDFANGLDEGTFQIHSKEYRSPSQLQPGDVLIVGAGNSGAEIALDLSPRHRVWLSGRDVGHVPFRIAGLPGRLILVRLVLRVLFHRILNVNNPIGRKARPKFVSMGGPLVRTRPHELEMADVVRVPRVVGVKRGQPLLEDGRLMDVRNVVWCTGFRPGFPEWIDLPVLDGEYPELERGIVPGQPGLYFVGLHFLQSASSVMIHGVGRDAERIARAVAAGQSGERAGHAGEAVAAAVA